MTSSGRVAGPYGAVLAGLPSIRSATPAVRGRCARTPATAVVLAATRDGPANPLTGPCALGYHTRAGAVVDR